MADSQSSTHLQHLLDLLHAGHDSARDSLLQHSLERCRLLARCMFPRTSDLRRLDETDDVVQKALLRLHRALAQVKPPNVPAYMGLAARQIRWVLRDLAREAASAKRVSYVGIVPDRDGPEDRNGEPDDLLEWTEFHAKIEALPEEERQVFDLLFYQGLTQPDASSLLGVPLRTLKRRWQRARLMLRDALRGEWPSLGDGP